VTPVYKLKGVIVDEYVPDKNLFLFIQIHLQFAEIASAKLGLTQEKTKKLQNGDQRWLRFS
jgi:hypothetical protein